ncbi:KIR-like protein [Plasmodium coatneyi]|uniref:KIR-like protein n=1 Tax=Plasmodium coatneyi TaxID=208452 RepID=A0A1B1E0F8_9APIC|nr:KIR-like protein [Plasmodium coatneyi]ANQ08516.1 KIR-like protein [Plasmodium coatneyi]
MPEPAKVQFPQSFPSNNTFYTGFDKEWGTYNEDDGGFGDLKKNLGAVLGTYTGVSDKTDKAMKAYCYASTLKESGAYDNIPCHFLYYWLGSILPRSAMYDGQFKSHINTICTYINEAHEGKRCKLILSENFDRNIFTHRKTIFDYSFDYNAIEGDLLAGTAHCGPQWKEYRQKVIESCGLVRPRCGKRESSGTTDPYCTEFKRNYQVYCDIAERLNEECTRQDTEKLTFEPESHPSTITEQDLRFATITTALSSIFGTLATISAPYLLYKYKPWSSWFGNHSGGRSRKKRTTGHHFDASTEDNLSEYTTDNSTTVRSAAYTTPSTRGGGGTSARRTNNTQSRGMVGYQNV